MAAAAIKNTQHDTPTQPPGGSTASLFEHYFQWFKVALANSPQEIEHAHRIRYQVYCVETAFLKCEDNPGGLEIDRFDVHADQALLVHQPTGSAAGTVRLVVPRADMEQGDLPARLAAPGLQGLGDELPLDKTGEISRFSVSKAFRRRAEDGLIPELMTAANQNPGAAFRRIVPHITLGLMQSVFEMAVNNKLTHLCAIIDPALLRLLNRLGIQFTNYGDPVEFHGLRQPVGASIESILDHLATHRPDVREIITDRGRLDLS